MPPVSSESDPLISAEARAQLVRMLRERLGSPGVWHPLSHAQDALWFIWKLAPVSAAYNIALPVGVRGPLDLGALRRALRHLSDRHAALRLEFAERDGGVFQRAKPRGDIALAEVDVAGFDEATLRAAVRAKAQRPFDLMQDASLRAVLLHRAADSHVLLLVLPHIVSDLWSFIVMMDELRIAYRAEATGNVPDLPPLGAAHEDYVRWQRAMLDGAEGQAHWDYWRSALAGDLPVLDLPFDRPRPPVPSFSGGTVAATLDAGLARTLKSLAASENATLFMALLTAFQALLYRYSGQDDIIVGAPTSGRQQSRFGGVIGDFVNMVPLRADLSGRPGFRELLRQTRTRVLGALAHQDFPFAAMVDRLQPARDLSRSPIFQASFVLQQFHRYEDLSRALLAGTEEEPIPFGDLALEPWPLDQQEGQFDLSLEMKEDAAGRIIGAWKYATDLFARDTIVRMARHFETLLRAITADPARPVAELPLLDADEATAAAMHGPAVEAPAETLVDLFEKEAARRPEEIAVVCGVDSMRYGVLAARTAHWAHRLAGKGVKRGDIVALRLLRGIDFVAALLAVMKAGAAFLPLDPRHPPARMAAILESAGVAHLIAPSTDLAALGAALPEIAPHRIALEDLSGINGSSALPPVEGRDLAYLMPTSGSTGLPKAVMVEHCGMLNHMLGKLDNLGFGERDVLAQNAPQSFDVVVWQALAPLAVGGRVIILPDGVAESPTALVDAVDAQGITVLQVVPAMLRALIEEAAARGPARPALASLRWMVPTGEALPLDLCRRWFALYPRIPILNTYGSTECSDDQCHYRVDRLALADESAAVIAIGTPIRNMHAHVLDRNLAPVPNGVAGELYIGGLGVGRGYRNDPQRTAAAFVPDPFGAEPGARLYRTRDLARRRSDGALEFLGRVDHMIKLNGLRIEPGEIESAVTSHPAVSAAAVLACEHPSGERRLVAYVAAASGAPPPAADDLRAHLQARLPASMLPSSFAILDALPLTANGKLDRARLPQPDWSPEPAETVTLPRNAREAALAAIWAAVLGQSQVSVTADFFALGGDSILSIQIAARCRRAGLAVEPRDLFLERTVAALAERMAEHAGAGADERNEDVPALPDLLPEHLARAAAQVRFDEGPRPQP